MSIPRTYLNAGGQVMSVFPYVYLSTGVAYNVSDGITPIGTGVWVPQSIDLFSTFITGVTGGQVQIPAGTHSYNIFVESGSAFINGVQINAGRTIAGGGYSNFNLGRPINVGTTGGRFILNYDL